jgi:hypothetical protein
MNLEKALSSGALEILFSILYLPENFKQEIETADSEERLRLPIYLKYCLRCITSCIRSPVGVTQMLSIKTSVSQILDFLETIKDEEILANSSKIIRIVLRDDFVSEFNYHSQIFEI